MIPNTIMPYLRKGGQKWLKIKMIPYQNSDSLVHHKQRSSLVIQTENTINKDALQCLQLVTMVTRSNHGYHNRLITLETHIVLVLLKEIILLYTEKQMSTMLTSGCESGFK